MAELIDLDEIAAAYEWTGLKPLAGAPCLHAEAITNTVTCGCPLFVLALYRNKYDRATAKERLADRGLPRILGISRDEFMAFTGGYDQRPIVATYSPEWVALGKKARLRFIPEAA
jgi:hypothetical protein